jgi:outer membrane immunogenic protein
MKKLPAAIVALSAFAAVHGGSMQSASAQRAYSWSGCYVGVNGGYGWNNGRTSYQNDPNSAVAADPIDFVPDPFLAMFGASYTYIPTPTATRGSGGLFGGGAGCNLQTQQWVYGVEADVDWAHIAGSNITSAFSGPNSSFAIGPGGTATPIDETAIASEQVSLRWLSTFRARAGIAVRDRLLLYVTGGVAVGGINTQGSVTMSSPFPLYMNPGWSGSDSTVKAGGVIGGGAEWAFSDHWTAKAEYLWYDLGHVSHQLNCSAGSAQARCGEPNNLGGFFSTLGDATSSVFGSIVRVGINYKFGP